MSAMISSFIYRSVKSSRRKGKKENVKIAARRVQSPASPASFMSPEIMDINEKSFAHMDNPSSPLAEESFESYESYDSTEYTRSHSNPMLLELNIPHEPLTDWFVHDLLRGAGARQVKTASCENVKGAVFVNGGGGGHMSREAFVFSSEEVVNQLGEVAECSSTEDLHKQAVIAIPKKPAPTPIRIPNAAIHGPKVQIQRSANMDSNTRFATNSQPPTDSPVSNENSSALSGTTLARALFANSFILSSDSRASRYRSGTSASIRQDSATLPGRDSSFLNSPYWRDKRISSGDITLMPNSGHDSSIPPVPPLPSGSSFLKSSRSARSSGTGSEVRENNHRQSGTELTRHASSSSQRSSRKSDSEILPSLVRSSSFPGSTTSERPTSRRISRIMEVPSPMSSAPGTPVKKNTQSVEDIHNPGSSMSPTSEQISSSEGPTPLDYDVPTPSPDFSTRPRRHSHSDTSLTPGSAQSMTVANVLENYLHASSPESQPALSPMASESSASMRIPAPYRTAPKRTSKKRKEGKMVLSANPSSIATVGKVRVGWALKKTSDARLHSSPQDGSKVKLLPIGERPGSLLVPQTPLTPGFIPTTGTPLRVDPSTASTSPPAISPTIHFFAGPETPIDSPDFLDSMFIPMPRGIFSRRPSGSLPDPIAVIRESKDISDFNITVSSESESSDANTPSTGSGHQTFPETPHAFSPLWSANTASGSPFALHIPSLSDPSSLVFVPGHSPRSASLSGTIQTHQPSLAQKVLLSRAITVTGNKSASKLHAVNESTELFGQTSTSSSSDGNSSSISIVENILSPTQPPAPAEPLPPLSPVVASPSQTRPARPLPATLLDVYQMSATSPLPASSITSSTLSTPPSLYPPLPDNHNTHSSSSSAPARSVSPAATPQTDILPVIQPSSLLHQRFPAEIDPTPSIAPPFIAPPPYHAVVDNQGSTEFEPHVQKTATPNETISGNTRRTRARPPLPIGPRKPSTGQLAPGSIRDRNGSVSSVGSSAISGNTGPAGLRKLLTQSSSPKFQTPAPKYRGYTMEAAKWTFTSQQLQAIVSRAIRQSAEASSVRLLRLETLDVDIPEEMHRLEMQKMDFKMRYRSLARQRWALLGSLVAHVDGSEGVDSATALRTLAELTEVSADLDHLAEELHGVTLQLANMKSLGDVHSASALAMALRKLNASFLKQVAETQVLRQQISSLEAERDEAWTQAEGVAQEYDELIDRYGEDFQMPHASKSPNSRRSSRVSAVRKSSIRVSKAGLRSANMRRSQRLSVGSSRHGHGGSESMSLSSGADIPPVPPMPYASSLGISTADLPSRSSMAELTSTPSSSTRAMIRAQEELYELLVSMSVARGERPRPLSLTSPSRHIPFNAKPPCSRPLSDIISPVGLGPSSMPGSARMNDLYADNSDAMLAATMSAISN